MHDNKLFDIVFKMCCDLQVADELVHEFSDPEKLLSPTDQVGLYLGKWFFLLGNACSQKIPIAPPPPGILWRDIGERAIYIYSHNTLKKLFFAYLVWNRAYIMPDFTCIGKCINNGFCRGSVDQIVLFYLH